MFEFNLNGPIENLDNVPSQYHGFYAQTDGGYQVAEQFVPAAKDINGLNTNLTNARSSLTRVNGESADRRHKIDAFTAVFDVTDGIEDQTPEALTAYIQDLRTKAKKGGVKGEEAAAEIERVKASMTAANAEALAGRDKEIEALTGEVRTLLVDNRISRAVSALEGNPTLLTPMLERECDVRKADDGSRVVVILNSKGEPRYNSSGDLFSIEERVEELRGNPDFAAAFKGQVKGGSGTEQGTVRLTKTGTGVTPDYDKMSAKQRASSMISAGLKKRRAGGRR